MKDEIEITSRYYWVKIVDFLQQSWALADSNDAGFVNVFFLDDRGGVFDQLLFDRDDEAVAALERNDFRRFRDSPDLQEFLVPPDPPFSAGSHPNGRIYSSGRFWR